MIKEKHINGLRCNGRTVHPMHHYNLSGMLEVIAFTSVDGKSFLCIYEEKKPLRNIEFDGIIIDELIETLQRIKKEWANPEKRIKDYNGES